MARCNHLLAVQLPATAALLANIASVSAWSGGTSASLVWHPSLQRKNCHLRTSSSSSVPSSSAFCQRHQSIPHFGGSQHRGYSLASTRRSDGSSEHNVSPLNSMLHCYFCCINIFKCQFWETCTLINLRFAFNMYECRSYPLSGTHYDMTLCSLILMDCQRHLQTKIQIEIPTIMICQLWY